MPDPKKQRAGRKGGQVVSQNRAHMAAIGRKGGQRSRIKRATQKQTTVQPSTAEQAPAPTATTFAQTDGQEHREAFQRPASSSRPEEPKHAIELLKADHEHVRSLYEQFETADGEDRQHLADTVMRELDVHSLIEEEVFYPAFQEKADQQGKDLVKEALDEHRAVKEALRELREIEPEDQAFERRFHDLMQDVEHHVGEEEGRMFPLAEAALGNRLVELGAEMSKRKQELLESFTTNAMR